VSAVSQNAEALLPLLWKWRRMKSDKTKPPTVQAKRLLTGSVGSVLFGQVTVLVVVAFFAHKYGPNALVTGDEVAIIAFLYSLALGFVLLNQIHLGVVAIDQQEQMRQDNTALVQAVEALTTELGKRPEPQPAQVNWALFNLPTSR
jgi:hypothetical protein